MSKKILFQDIETKESEDWWRKHQPEASKEDIEEAVAIDLKCERSRFKRALEKLDSPYGFVVFCENNLWNRKICGIRFVKNATELAGVGNVDAREFYVDDYNFLMRGIHHDGTNYYEIRELKSKKSFSCLLKHFDKYGGFTSQVKSRHSKSLRHDILKARGHVG